VAANPATGGARCAPLGVVRALSRVVVLGGLVIAGWLLGSGIGLANEDLGQPGTGLAHLLSAHLVSAYLVSGPGDRTAPSDSGPGGQLGVPPAVGSTITRALSALPVPDRSGRPPVKLGVLQPIVNTVGVPKPLAPVLSPPILAPQVLAAVSEPATVPPTEPATQAAFATAPVSVQGSTQWPTQGLTRGRGPAPVNHARPAAAPTASPFAGPSALDDDPAAPVPASPPGSTSSPYMIGSAGSGAGTKGAPGLAVNGSWATVGPTPMYRLLYLSASELPPSPAARPSTSPD
jgi:hypothetical protein